MWKAVTRRHRKAKEFSLILNFKMATFKNTLIRLYLQINFKYKLVRLIPSHMYQIGLHVA
jgi:hypothetical protein